MDMEKAFDTKVQQLKYRVLREISKEAISDTLLRNITDIPRVILPGRTPSTRCCVYKERAILAERVKLGVGGDKCNPNIIETIQIACDECPVGGYFVTDVCRGCIAHPCEASCRVNAISFDVHLKAQIDKTKCVDCGSCAKACPYSAISNRTRPCEKACKVGAIYMNEIHAAAIDGEKCVACGACVYQCPFGAIMDKSYILNALDLIEKSIGNGKYHLYAIVAPAIGSQFAYAKPGQVISAIHYLGFYDVLETALGADMTAKQEARELEEKGFLTSSCCPAFVDYVRKNFPEMMEKVSSTPSPMLMLSKYIKEKDPGSKVIFIGPCTAKKMEAMDEKAKPYIDCVLTFEELQAMIGSLDIDITTLPETELSAASKFGRGFAVSGGLAAAVAEAVKESGSGFEVKTEVCMGIEACRIALLRASKGKLQANFIEGMACQGGCVGGAGCLTHGPKSDAREGKYIGEAKIDNIDEALRGFEMEK